MNRVIIIVCNLLIASNLLHAAEEPIIQEQSDTTINASKNTIDHGRLANKKTFLFQFQNKDLVDVINLIAAEKRYQYCASPKTTYCPN